MLQQFAAWVQGLVIDLGYPGLFVLIVLESTLVPIPSELVMPFAGYLAQRGDFSLPVILVINSVAAMVGSGICYWLGKTLGKPFLVKYGKFFLLRQKDIERTERFFASHGRATILIGRFLPVVRHVISIPAGIARMPLVPFFTQTFIGATIWGSVLIMIGYELGEKSKTIAEQLKHVDLIVGVVIICVLLALAIRFVIRRRRDRETVQNNAD
ncbi:MAG: rane protein DedA [Myxococcales bacterium]|nr:rane protein DedA [Myxococcales bacterium]